MLGIDIDEKSIKLAEVAAGPRLVNFAVENDPPSAKALEKIIKNINPAETDAYCVLSGKSVLIYSHLFPVMSEKELKEAVFWEARELISFPIEEAVVTFEKVGERLEGGVRKIEVILVIIERSYLQSLQNLLAEAGLKVKGLTPAAFALWDLIKFQYQASGLTGEQTIAVLDLGAAASSLNIFVGGHLKLTREISSAAQEEALSAEISQTISYVAEKGIAAKVDLLLLAGPGSCREGLDQFLAKSLSVETQVLDPLKNVEVAHPTDELTSCRPQLATALGLALGKAASLNLISLAKVREEKPLLPRIPTRQLLLALVSLFAVAALFFLPSYFIRSFKDNLKKELLMKNEELKMRQMPARPAAEAELRIVLSDLWKILPGNFSFDELTYLRAKKTVNFSGVLPNQEILGKLLYNLQTVGRYKEVKLVEIRKEDRRVRAKIEVIL